MLTSFFKRDRVQGSLLDKQSQTNHPAAVYVLSQLGVALLFFGATLMLYAGFKDSLAELLLVLTDSRDEELTILSLYTQESLYLFLALFGAYLLCCVFITVNACKRSKH